MAVRSIEGQVVLVTGSAIRIGRAIALHLAAAGATIAVHCNRSKEEAEQTAAEIRENGVSAEVFGADLAKSYDREVLIQQVVGKFGGLHHLVNSAS
ncbi:MAG TPA: SDR family NAD(P)-dependent oxidoreductase, partial [Candidatus Poseidoniales archaeon]|nr:SDR family NAD(P)-dependent oxidoreductase [Candidatus Poseidoniales archaeon]